MEWGHNVMENRIGKSGLYAEIGDVVEVVKGRKYPVGMKMVVCDFTAWCKYDTDNFLYHSGRSFQAYGDKQIVFGGEGKMEKINADNVKIIALTEDRSNPEYRNVHKIEVY